MTGIEVLTSIGAGVTSNAIWQYISTKLLGKSRAEAERDLDAFLTLQGVTVKAPKVLDALAANGFLLISGSTLEAGKALTVAAAQGASFRVEGSTLRNVGAGSSVTAEGNASASGTNAGINLDENGNINIGVGITRR